MVKDREFDDRGQVRLNPLWYRLGDFKPTLLERSGLLERTGAVWHYAVDEDGESSIGSDQPLTIAEADELVELLTAMQTKNPDLTMDQLKAAIDNQGHPTVAAAFDPTGAARIRPARISGELSYRTSTGRWEVTDKSGRYMSNKIRPSVDPEAAQRWLAEVAREMSRHFGVEVAPLLFKNAQVVTDRPQ
ncbi:hypothetical protein ACWGJV_37885 [Streptomyces tendae]